MRHYRRKSSFLIICEVLEQCHLCDWMAVRTGATRVQLIVLEQEVL